MCSLHSPVQVMGLFHAPLSVVCRSVAVLPEELLRDALAMAWEMLLEHDNEVAEGRGVTLPACLCCE